MQQDTTKNVSENKTQPSFARLLRQMMFVPVLHNRWLDAAARKRLSAKVSEVEKGHRGEVVLVVENHLPIADAYTIGCSERALELFSLYGVWDTEENTGVLIYVNVCEQSLEIIADRGINSHVSPTVWKAMCDKAVAGIASDKAEESLDELLSEVGLLLREFYHLEDDPQGNELSDTMIYIK